MSPTRGSNCVSLGRKLRSSGRAPRSDQLQTTTNLTTSSGERGQTTTQSTTLQAFSTQESALTNTTMLSNCRSRPLPLLSAKVAEQVDMIWDMARESMAANNYQIILTPKICQSIGSNGLELLKLRLR